MTNEKKRRRKLGDDAQKCYYKKMQKSQFHCRQPLHAYKSIDDAAEQTPYWWQLLGFFDG